GQYIHIGGDEANKQPWVESAFCQELIHKLDLKDEHELQSYFIRRMEKFINAKGKSIIGWDEILEGGLAPNAAVMSWRGEKGGIAAAQQRHKVVMTPGPNGMYFDHYQSASPMEPDAHVPSYGGYAPLSKTYSYDPVPASLDPQEQAYIMGVQANLWTEHIGTLARVQYMIIPRIFALSEIAWTPVARKEYGEFAAVRMPAHLAKFDAMGWDYRVPAALPETDTLRTGRQFTFQLTAPIPGARIYYTLNGHTPGDYDWLYEKPITITVPPGEKRELQTLVITPAGRRSVATKTVIYNPQAR
ncbi:MAG: family 20 glycosylhydrolase, partial [Bacteroidetes bacterium]|nr:family 20 glycosylhydrolase [Bacteroidota bacterium]